MRFTTRAAFGGLAAALVVGLTMVSTASGGKLSGDITVDGSSTVFPITQAVAAQFKKLHPGVNVSIGISGTGGGMKRFGNNEIDIANASRRIKPAEEDKCKANAIQFTELQIGWDGLANIVHKDNTWARKMTLEQLKKIWHPETKARLWSDVDPSWPKEEIKLYGAGTDSGTFDFFTEAVNGKEKLIRSDYNATEDDNITVNGVARNKYALGFLGVAYYEANSSELGVVALAGKDGSFIAPEEKEILSRRYPISRPLFIYVKHASLKRPEVQEFATFLLRNRDLVKQARYVPLTRLNQTEEQAKLEKAIRNVK